MSSNKPHHLLVFEWDPKNEVLEIHGDQTGLENLKDMIESLIKRKGPDHIHLMTEEWGGRELNGEKQNSQDDLINHVKIFKWIH